MVVGSEPFPRGTSNTAPRCGNMALPMNPIVEALKIASGYFVARGYPAAEASRKPINHIIKQADRGEHRPMVLANRAIEAVQRDEEAERQIENELRCLVREHP